MKKFFSNAPNLLKLSYQGWKEDNASQLAAALAYYTIFSLAPLLVIVIAIAGLFWHRQGVQSQVMDQVQSLVGAQGRTFVLSLLNSVNKPAEGIVATIIGVLTLLLGALGVFTQLQNALNIIWDIREEQTKGFLQAVKKVIFRRLLSFSMILGIGFLLLVSLIISAGLSAVQRTIGNAIPISEIILQLVNLVISIGVITILFALIYKLLPEAEIAWRDVWLGAFVTAILFSLGKLLIGLYLGNSAITSSFGAAGSLALLLIWIYYSAQILFFGAEFAQVYANQYGSRIVPEDWEETARPERRGTRQFTPQPAIPVTSAPTTDHQTLQRQNRQTARVFVGLMAVSFFTGIATAILGRRRR